ncbi:MAG: undecaprenyl-phosphate glucose phosphotransferase [Gammaproteobacteria bacterium]
MPTEYHRIGFSVAALTVLQSTLAPLISALALVFSTWMSGTPFTDEYEALAIIAALLCFIFMRPAISEEWGTFTTGWPTVSRVVLGWLAVAGVLLLLGYATKTSETFSRSALFLWVALTPPLIAGCLILLRKTLRAIVIASGDARSAVIAGANDVSQKLALSTMDRPELGLKFKGFFDDRGLGRLKKVPPEQLLGTLADLPEFVKRERIDVVFIAIPVNHMQRTQDLLNELRDTTISIYFVPDIFVFDLIQSRTSELNGIPIVALCETPFYGWRGVVKRASDVVLASMMLVLSLPVMAVIAIAIKLTSRGTVMFKQRRYGLDGQEIIVYKFRTMTVAEDGGTIRQATKDDDRITRVGRFLRRSSLDELPQLVNVLQGRMSVVGPRPHAVSHNEQYRKLIDGYMVRHKVTPGITGLAQVSGFRGETAALEDMEKRIHYDLEYLRHWSLFLDLKILFKTFAVWFRDEKAY